jgi:hypothetical protein
VEQAVQDSIKMAEKGKRYVEHVRAQLEFISADLESGSYKGPTRKGPVNGVRQRRSLGTRTKQWKPAERVLKAWQKSYAAWDS